MVNGTRHNGPEFSPHFSSQIEILLSSRGECQNAARVLVEYSLATDWHLQKPHEHDVIAKPRRDEEEITNVLSRIIRPPDVRPLHLMDTSVILQPKPME